MKNMKKFSGLIALICVLLSIMLLATACGEAKSNDSATTENTAASTEAPATGAPTTEAPTTGENEGPSDPGDGKVTYKVTIIDEDGKPVEGVSVQMCDDAGCKLPSATNAEGVVEFRYAPSNYHVTLLGGPAGYVIDTTAYYVFTDNQLKILLKKAPATVTYKVEVVDYDGFVLEGVSVLLSGSDLPAVKTNADGVATFAAPEGNYGVELSDIPEGLGKEFSYSFPAGKTEIKIALPALPAYTLSAQDLFGQPVVGVEVNVFRKDAGNLVATKTTGADGKVTFYLAEAEYTVTLSNPAGYTLNVSELEFNATTKSITAFYLKGVSGEKSYQVVVMDMFYQSLANVKVSIYKLADDSLVMEEYTTEWGTVDVMLPVDEYYAVIDMPDGYTTAENKFLFNVDRVAEAILEGGEVATNNYSVLVQDSVTGAPIAGVTVTLMHSMRGTTIGTAVTGADGIAIFENIEDGMYFATVAENALPEGYELESDGYFMGMMKEATVTLKREATGAEDAPFAIEDEETFISLEAGKTVYYVIAMPDGKILTVNNANVVIKIGETVYTAENGVLTIAFESYDYDAKLLAIYTADGAAAEFTLTFKGAAGTMDNPIVLETLGDYTATVAENGDGIYYQWVATQSGVLVFKTNNVLNNCSLANVSKYWYGNSAYGGYVLYMTVEAGDVIEIYVDTMYSVALGMKPGAEILFNLSMSTAAEDQPLDLISGSVDTFMPAGSKYYYTIPSPAGLKLVIQAGFGENPVVVLGGVEYTVDPMNGQIKIVFDGTDPVTFCLEAKDAELLYTTVSVSNANGSGTMDDPYLLNSLDKLTVSVPENSEGFYYSWTATASGTLTLTMNSELNNVCVNNLTTWAYGDPTFGALTTTMVVNEGDEIQISVGTVTDYSTWTSPAADIEITFTLA